MSASAQSSNVQLPARDWLLLGAMAILGLFAARLVSHALFLGTPLAIYLVYKGAVRHAQGNETVDLYGHPDLPYRARRAVDAAAAQLSNGQARTLLASVVTQAVLLFQAQETLIGAAADNRGMLDDVSELVETACTSAEQLALLDAATQSPDAASRAARERFTTSLASAATVIRNLHVAVVGGGTVASDRVEEITEDLRGEASARTRAMAELASLLDQRRRG